MIALDRASPSGAHWSEEQYRELFQPADSPTRRLVLVAENAVGASYPASSQADETPVGFLVARHLAPEWELENIDISGAARRHGLGSRLLDALLNAARETHSEAVFLEVRESNLAARRLYRKAGFDETGRRKSYYSNPLEDAILYRLGLP
jgi:ribosomal-protein-alanine acetyltransferase